MFLKKLNYSQVIPIFSHSSTPFDESTFKGWTCVFCLDLIFGCTYAVVHVAVGALFLATGFYFEACAHHFGTFFEDTRDFNILEAKIELKLKIKKSLVEAINFHNTTKR